MSAPTSFGITRTVVTVAMFAVFSGCSGSNDAPQTDARISGTDGAAPADGGADAASQTCSSLGAPTAAKEVYTPSVDGVVPMFFSSDSGGALVTHAVDRAIRVVRVGVDGNNKTLLDENAYTRPWSFDPTSVVAAPHGSGVDVLVSDKARLVLLRAAGQSVRVVELADTNYLDLVAVGLATNGSRTLAVYSRGDEPATLYGVDLEPLLTQAPQATDLTAEVQNAAVSLTTSDRADFVSALPDGKGALWLAVERLDATTECVDTGEEVPFGVGGKAPVIACDWHLDLRLLNSPSDLSKAPITTIDAKLHAAYGYGTAAELQLHNVAARLSRERRHHVIATSAFSGQLGVLVQHEPSWQDEQLLVAAVPSTGTAVQAKAISMSSAGLLVALTDANLACGDTGCMLVRDQAVESKPPLSFAFRPEFDYVAQSSVFVLGRNTTNVPSGTKVPLILQTLPCVE